MRSLQKQKKLQGKIRNHCREYVQRWLKVQHGLDFNNSARIYITIDDYSGPVHYTHRIAIAQRDIIPLESHEILVLIIRGVFN